MTTKKAAPQYQQSSPSQGQSITTLSLFTVEEFVSLLILPALVGLYWLCEVFV
ncbi:hypothetical protein [Stutzerimonas nitrititolerans]|uniref:hypothetical protein n=1 Tax=Stutzerimonas nitrititolerans TaxID=2482751 RepID=UPI00289E210B|nr:hypothetical protein [Stutzerimonas nitrititolerans]